MEIGPASRVDMSAPAMSQPNSQEWPSNDRPAIAAVQWLNQTEWLGQDRKLTYSRDRETGRLVIQILDRQTGDVLDQIPPEFILRLVNELQAQLKVKDE